MILVVIALDQMLMMLVSMQNCSGFIQKPFRLASLSKKVRELLGAAQDENR